MSLTFNLATPKKIIEQPEVSRTLTDIFIENIVDVPSEKRIFCHVAYFGRVELDTLSGDNYNNPPWTDEMIINAVKAKLDIS